MLKYPNLGAEMVRRNVTNKDIAQSIHVCTRTFQNKLSGRVAFTWPEVKAIRKQFFPDLTLDELFLMQDEAEKDSA